MINHVERSLNQSSWTDSEYGISIRSIYIIFHKHLVMSQVSASRLQVDTQNMQDRQQRVESSLEIVEVDNPNPEDVHTCLVTGDETWLHH